MRLRRARGPSHRGPPESSLSRPTFRLSATPPAGAVPSFRNKLFPWPGARNRISSPSSLSSRSRSPGGRRESRRRRSRRRSWRSAASCRGGSTLAGPPGRFRGGRGWSGTARTPLRSWRARGSRPTRGIRCSAGWGSTAPTTRRSRPTSWRATGTRCRRTSVSWSRPTRPARWRAFRTMPATAPRGGSRTRCSSTPNMPPSRWWRRSSTAWGSRPVRSSSSSRRRASVRPPPSPSASTPSSPPSPRGRSTPSSCATASW